MHVDIRPKLLAGFALVLALTAALGVTALGAARHARLAGRALRRHRRGRDLGPRSKYRKDQFHYVIAKPGDDRKGVADDLAGDESDLAGYFATSDALSVSSAARARRTTFARGWRTYAQAAAPFRAPTEAGRPDAALAAFTSGVADHDWDQIKADLKSWQAQHAADAKAAAAAARSTRSSTRTLVELLLGAAILVGVAVALLLARRVGRIRTLARAADALAVGDLAAASAVEVRGGDEIGRAGAAFGRMTTYLEGMAEVAAAVGRASAAAAHSASGIRGVADGTAAAAAEQARVAASAKEVADETAEFAAKGVEAAHGAVDAIGHVRGAAERLGEVVAHLGARSAEIDGTCRRSPASRIRRTCSPSTPRSRRRGPASTAAASRSSPRRSASRPRRPAARAARSPR